MFRILAFIAVLLLPPAVAVAQETLPDTEAERFILRRVDGGLMRIDRETGETSFCRKRNKAWTCEIVADDRVALEEEIARLSEDNSELAREIGRLKERIARLETGAAPADKPKKPAPGDGNADEERPALDLPSDKEIDQVMKTFESMMRRFLDMVRDLRDEYEQDRT